MRLAVFALHTYCAPFHRAAAFRDFLAVHKPIVSLAMLTLTLMSGTDTAVREWAHAQGMDVSRRGRVGNDVRAAYDAAHGRGSRPDAAPSGDGADPANLEALLEAEGQQADPEFAQDPAPVRPKAGAASTPPAPPKKAAKIPDSVRRDIRAKISLLLMFPAGWAARRDPLCGAELQEQLPDIATALADIACDSPDVVQFFTSAGGGYIKWLNLAIACQPVAEVFVKHHVTHTIGLGEDGAPAEYVPPDMSAYHAPAI